VRVAKGVALGADGAAVQAAAISRAKPLDATTRNLRSTMSTL